MNKKDFSEKVYELIVKEDMNIYRELFNIKDMSTVTDSYWKEAIELYKGLSDKNKEVFFDIIKQVSVDAVSSILALIDGVTFLEGQDDELNLTFENTNEKINGDLQDLFLECHESNI